MSWDKSRAESGTLARADLGANIKCRVVTFNGLLLFGMFVTFHRSRLTWNYDCSTG